MEKELLAIVFACERFDQFVYGRFVTVEFNHKRLAKIATKPSHNIPKRLQRMLLRLQKYDAKMTYNKGEQLLIADTLSRAYLTKTDNGQMDAVLDSSAQGSVFFQYITYVYIEVCTRYTYLQSWTKPMK